MVENCPILWLIVEERDNEFLVLQRACSSLEPRPKLHRARDDFQAQCYLHGVGDFARRDLFPLPTLILLSLKAPVLDRLGLLTWTKAQRSLRSIPVVVLTDSKIAYHRLRTHDLGADKYLVKPAGATALARELQSLFAVI